jgi:hypothetical protein
MSSAPGFLDFARNDDQRVDVRERNPRQVVSAYGLRYCSSLKRASTPACLLTTRSLLHDDG